MLKGVFYTAFRTFRRNFAEVLVPLLGELERSVPTIVRNGNFNTGLILYVYTL